MGACRLGEAAGQFERYHNSLRHEMCNVNLDMAKRSPSGTGFTASFMLAKVRHRHLPTSQTCRRARSRPLMWSREAVSGSSLSDAPQVVKGVCAPFMFSRSIAGVYCSTDRLLSISFVRVCAGDGSHIATCCSCKLYFISAPSCAVFHLSVDSRAGFEFSSSVGHVPGVDKQSTAVTANTPLRLLKFAHPHTCP